MSLRRPNDTATGTTTLNDNGSITLLRKEIELLHNENLAYRAAIEFIATIKVVKGLCSAAAVDVAKKAKQNVRALRRKKLR